MLKKPFWVAEMRLNFAVNLSYVLMLLQTVNFVVDIILVDGAATQTNFTSVVSKQNNISPSTPSILDTGDCKDRNWTQFRASCYRVYKTFNYFTTAQKICQDSKATLVSISDAEENRFIQRLVAKNTRYKEAWIGLRLNTVNNKYEWTDKTRLSYENWLYDSYRSDGKCAQLIPGGTWSNILCYSKLQFVCKKAVSKSVPVENNTKIIILITLPLACVSIMMMFVGYLCFRSHQEIKSLPEEERKCSQNFVDVVSNNTSVGTEGLTSPLKESEEVQNEFDNYPVRKKNNNDIIKKAESLPDRSSERKYTERKKRTYSSPNGSEKMYKQVTFV